jgi:hypothetical protein
MRSDISRFALIAGAVLGVAAIAGAAGGSRRRGSAVDSSAVEASLQVVTPPDPPRGRRFRRRSTLLAVLALGVIGAGVAVAAWNVTGSGSGYAKAGSASALTIEDATASTVADLYPGATGAAKLKVTNPNLFGVRITTVTGAGAITSDKGASCDAATGVAFTNLTGQTLDVAAGAMQTFTLAGAVAMSNASDDACQGAVFTIPVSVSGVSN